MADSMSFTVNAEGQLPPDNTIIWVAAAGILVIGLILVLK